MEFKNTLYLNDDQDYTFNLITKCTNCKHHQFAVAMHSLITAKLSAPWLQPRGQFPGALTKPIRPKSCPRGFLLLGRATKLWASPSEVSLVFTQSLQQTERSLSSHQCISCFTVPAGNRSPKGGKNTNTLLQNELSWQVALHQPNPPLSENKKYC